MCVPPVQNVIKIPIGPPGKGVSQSHQARHGGAEELPLLAAVLSRLLDSELESAEIEFRRRHTLRRPLYLLLAGLSQSGLHSQTDQVRRDSSHGTVPHASRPFIAP